MMGVAERARWGREYNRCWPRRPLLLCWLECGAKQARRAGGKDKINVQKHFLAAGTHVSTQSLRGTPN